MSSNTGTNKRKNLFVKGDPRINRNGRPKVFDALREMAQEIAYEIDQKTGLNRAQLILKDWADSREQQKQKGLIEIAFGKVPDEIDVKGMQDIKITVEYTNKK